ncbi:hypothetical protein PoB_000518300 [Plakobranchus ocellatus]|uniref:Uncharacterized protein n=1 Tax=Plakobranchus ocellatus TaxID=259542 RepID=A0AAV3Y849_9GAST|nr:hypothetical protein PoB_000518300 [Plakobranchus ocellatus]
MAGRQADRLTGWQADWRYADRHKPTYRKTDCSAGWESDRVISQRSQTDRRTCRQAGRLTGWQSTGRHGDRPTWRQADRASG